MTDGIKGISVCNSNQDVFVHVSGRGTFQNGQPLRRYSLEMLNQGVNQFHVDLADCQGMDSTFLGVLAGIGLRLSQDGGRGRLFVINVSSRNMELLQTLGLDRLFNVEGATRDREKHAPPGHLEFQRLPDSDIGALSKPLNKNDTADLMLEAHDNLVRADQRNVAKFKDLTRILREDVERRGTEKEKP